jgi:hypothetical protein
VESRLALLKFGPIPTDALEVPGEAADPGDDPAPEAP